MAHRALASLTALSMFVLLAGCPKDDKKPETKDEKSESSKKKSDDSAKDKGGDDDDGSKKKKPAKGDDDKDDGKGDDDSAGAAGGKSIGGVTVPAWKKPKASGGKCARSKDDEAKLAALKKGDDGGAGFDDGKGDVGAIVSEMKDTCPSAGAAVSQAMNAGGYTRYSKKKYDDADGWFARALVADPSNTFARYNLACNLALEGKSDEAVWNLGELVPAAKAGDPRALHYLHKAKSDSDLSSVRGDAKYAEATSAGDALAKSHPCDEGLVWDGKSACIQVCAGYGTKAGCKDDDTCSGATVFGDGLVPYCDNALHCKGDESVGFKADPNDLSSVKRACVIVCDSDANCPAPKKCTGVTAMPTIDNTFLYSGGCE